MDSTSDYNKPRRRKGNYSRLIISAIFVLFQIVFLIWAFFSLNIFALTSYIIIHFLTAMTALNIVVDKRKASYKIAWITVLIIIPIFGLICYLMWGQPHQSKVLKRRIPIISEMTIPLYKWNPQTRSRLVEQYPEMERRMVHLNKAGFPIYENTATKYFAIGDEYFTALFDDIKKAEKFIFLEYFIVSSGNILDELMEILKILKEKGIHTAIETNGTSERLQEILGYIDYLIMDFKHYDGEVLKKYTGMGNKTIKYNFEENCRKGRQQHIRIPLINKINTEKPEKFAEYFSRHNTENTVFEFLPYHEYGKGKWKEEYKVEDGFVSEEAVNDFVRIFKEHGLRVINT